MFCTECGQSIKPDHKFCPHCGQETFKPPNQALDTEAWTSLGSSYGQEGNWQQAGVASQKTIELDPSNAWAWSNLGLSYGQLGNHKQAAEASQKATELDPSNAWAWRDLGWSYGALGNHKQAGEAYQKAIEITDDPDLTRDIKVALDTLGAH